VAADVKAEVVAVARVAAVVVATEAAGMLLRFNRLRVCPMAP
jgi:hypothetical protein